MEDPRSTLMQARPMNPAPYPLTHQQGPMPPEGDGTGGVIPYKNVPALIGYYLGVFSILPLFPIGIAALVLGILGLRKRRRHPEVKGAVHAWIGIVGGGLFGGIWLVLTSMLVLSAAS